MVKLVCHCHTNQHLKHENIKHYLSFYIYTCILDTINWDVWLERIDYNTCTQYNTIYNNENFKKPLMLAKLW